MPALQSTFPSLKSKLLQQQQRCASSLAARRSSTPGPTAGKPPPHQTLEIALVELEGREREHLLMLDQLRVAVKMKESIIDNMKDENTRLSDKVEEMEEEMKEMEEELKSSQRLEEMEEILGMMKEKTARIEELEEALRLSDEGREEAHRLKEITEKLSQLEDKLKAAKDGQRASAADDCKNCVQLRQQLQEIREQLQTATDQLQRLLKERRQLLEELYKYRNGSLLEALSEKDAELARLEEVGLRTEESKSKYKALTQAKAVLLNTIQKQGEERVRLLQDMESPSANALPRVKSAADSSSGDD